MTAIPDNAKLTQDSAQIIIGVNRVTENWTKSITLFTPPKVDSERDTANPKNETKFIDLGLKAEKRLSFDGWIFNSASNRDSDINKNYDGTTITDATDMKNVLETMFFVGNPFTVNWNGTDYSANSDKFEARWVANDKDTITSYDIKFTIVVGSDM